MVLSPIDEGFYGAVVSLVSQSMRPILMTTSHPAFTPTIAKLIKKPIELFSFRSIFIIPARSNRFLASTSNFLPGLDPLAGLG